MPVPKTAQMLAPAVDNGTLTVPSIVDPAKLVKIDTSAIVAVAPTDQEGTVNIYLSGGQVIPVTADFSAFDDWQPASASLSNAQAATKAT